jgi:hypothetical protein
MKKLIPLFINTIFFLHVGFYNNGKNYDIKNILTLDSLQEW